MIDVSIVIVTWNNASDIERCLDSLGGVEKGIKAHIVVIDNASRDATVEMVRARYPGARLIANKQNVGFAAANNQAFSATESRYVMLLNPDTTVDAGTIEALVSYMDRNPAAWVAGPVILNPDRSVQRSGVRFPTRWNILVETFFLDRLLPKSRLFGAHKEVYHDPGKPRFVDFLQGSALMVRREALEKVGGLDEGFFMYFEEADWCYRIREGGGEVHYAPVGSVIHFGGEAFAHFDERRLVYYHHSLLRFFRKHYSTQRAAGLRAILIVRSLIRFLVWVTIALAKPSQRDKALSSARGYRKVLDILKQRT
jgi:N-acetylglucosaminyl-diphospho-decaprenol L-rhamnosyltransferase